MKSLGLKDIPLLNKDEETLGLAVYADSLKDFIVQCETPITIALQGDWGSGKTSLMNIIQSELSKESVVRTVWFNTWQFSQFQMGNDLTISFVSHLVDEIDAGNNSVKKIISGLQRFGKAGALTLASLVGQKDVTQEFLSSLEGNSEDPAKAIKRLKYELEKLIKQEREKNKKERIVFFVDDLDRLLPEKAVELLEVMKLFLDIDGCVFVLACDYQVVSKGLKKKFGLGSEDLSGKSFFDKIIQLPFSMPVSNYDVKSYIRNLLDKIGIEYDADKDIPMYADMVAYSCGFNPRSLKRLFNSLLLLNLVAEKRNLYEADVEVAKKREKQRAIFGTLCLQTAFEHVYLYIRKNHDKLDQGFFDGLRDYEKLAHNQALLEYLKGSVLDNEENLRRIGQFMDVFFEAIQLDSDEDNETISDEEIKIVKQVLSFSGLTSTSGPEADFDPNARYENRDVVKKLIEHFNKLYKDKLAPYSKSAFKLYQARQDTAADAYFNLHLFKNSGKWIQPNFYFDTDKIWFFIYGDVKATQKVADELIQEETFTSQFDVNPDENGDFLFGQIKFNAGMLLDEKVKVYQGEVERFMEVLLPYLEENKEKLSEMA